MQPELIWAAGFFDGEGSTCVGRGDGTKRHPPQLRIAIQQTELEPLERFQRAVDAGTLRGPYDRRRRSTHRPYYSYEIRRHDEVLGVLESLWPYLCLPKRQQARAAFTLIEQLMECPVCITWDEMP